MTKLALGTVQFGMDYGVANDGGQTPVAEVVEILDYALEQGIALLDTAPAYADSEKVLGRLDAGRRFNIISKTSVTNADVAVGLTQSLADLNCDGLYALLVHHGDDLLQCGESLWSSLQALKQQQKIQKIGVSVYNPAQLEAILSRFAIDIVQLPLNLFDQRMLRSGLLQQLKARGVEVHVRSAFLQGLLLMPVDKMSDYFQPLVQHFQRMDRYLQHVGMSRLQAALGLLKNNADVDKIVVGVTSLNELKAIVAAYDQADVAIDYSQFQVDDERMINPVLWQRS